MSLFIHGDSRRPVNAFVARKKEAPQQAAPSVCWIAASTGGLVNRLLAIVRAVTVSAIRRRRRGVGGIAVAVAVMSFLVATRRQESDGAEHAGHRAEHGRVAATAAIIVTVWASRRRSDGQ